MKTTINCEGKLLDLSTPRVMEYLTLPPIVIITIEKPFDEELFIPIEV